MQAMFWSLNVQEGIYNVEHCFYSSAIIIFTSYFLQDDLLRTK